MKINYSIKPKDVPLLLDLTSIRTLIYYDGVQMWLSKDQFEEDFLCWKYGEEIGYLALHLTPQLKDDLFQDRIDLLSAIKDNLPHLYLVKYIDFGSLEVVTKPAFISEEMLPDTGLFLGQYKP